MFTINNKKYIERINKHERMSQKDIQIRAMFAMTGAFDPPKRYIEIKESVNIREEFKLIQHKQSKLSRSDREIVENIFFEQYEEAMK